MTGPITGSITGRSAAPETKAPTSEEKKLRKTAQQLEGVFVQQLYKAMRDTVPQEGGMVDTSSGEDMFSGLMDQKLAADTPTQWAHGLADAAYRRLRKALPGAAAEASHAAAAMPLTPTQTPIPLAPAAPMKLGSTLLPLDVPSR